ncbi:hypothetical protein [Pseudomonas sp.]|uniref:hypothetical protein n=1 Tax=Pseudomonas sp. TaxID=306 RepID=UPI002FC7ED89
MTDATQEQQAVMQKNKEWKYIGKTLFSWVLAPAGAVAFSWWLISSNLESYDKYVDRERTEMQAYVDTRVGDLEKRLDKRDTQLSGDIQQLTNTVQSLVDVIKHQQTPNTVSNSSGNKNGSITVNSGNTRE